MFSRKSKEEKERERIEEEQRKQRAIEEEQRKTAQRQQLEEQRKERAREEVVIRARNAIIESNRDKLKSELNDKEIVYFVYSPVEKVVVAVYPDRIRLRSFQKSSLLATGLRGEKTIYLSKITSVQLKEPGTISSGYIQFKIGGEGESRSSTMNAVSDENAVVFGSDQYLDFKRLRDIVEDLIHKAETSPGWPSPTKVPPASLADELSKLAALREQGILTDDEFDAQKKRILGLMMEQ